MKKLIHKIYMFFGHIVCRLCLAYAVVRDKLCPPKADTILFVAHPDDDALFFHSFIKKEKPYVVLLMTGWSVRRLICFFKVMKYYGVKCRAYDLVSAKVSRNDPKWFERLDNEIKNSLHAGHFTCVATHNEEGEYGHPSHRAVHAAVKKLAPCDLITPVFKSVIRNYPLPADVLKDKEYVFRKLYFTEAWTIDELPEWMENEQLTVCPKEK